MNELEIKMLDMLKAGKEKYGYVGVKAEFEAEGTRICELLRLAEMARKANVKIALKIGGCEAVTDLLTARQIGVDYIIAPMIETAYALSKYIEAKNKIYSTYEQEHIKFLFNLETITAFDNLEAMLSKARPSGGADGIVFGRNDFALSKELSEQDISGEEITAYCLAAAQKCKDHNLEMVVGGGMDGRSLTALKKIHQTHLDRFETRKIVFDADIIHSPKIEEALSSAINFELLWLKNKCNYYYNASQEDIKRIKTLESRQSNTIKPA